MELGLQIQNLRRFKKVSVPELSRDIGVSKSLLYQFEKGRTNVSIRTLEKILSKLDGKFFVTFNYSYEHKR